MHIYLNFSLVFVFVLLWAHLPFYKTLKLGERKTISINQILIQFIQGKVSYLVLGGILTGLVQEG